MATDKVNIHQTERNVSTALGGVVLLRSFTRGSLSGIALGSALLYRGISGHSFLYQALNMSTADGNKQSAPEVERSITIEKPAQELYRLWSDPQNITQVMGDFADVTQVSDKRSHWVLHSPLNRRMEWDTEIVENRPGELLRWKSVEGAPLPNEMAVRFHPAPRDWGTVVTLHVRFTPPGGALGSGLLRRLRIGPSLAAEKILRRFKSLAETGEIPTLKRNPAARPGAFAQANA